MPHSLHQNIFSDILNPEYGGNKFLRNVVNYTAMYVGSNNKINTFLWININFILFVFLL